MRLTESGRIAVRVVLLSRNGILHFSTSAPPSIASAIRVFKITFQLETPKIIAINGRSDGGANHLIVSIAIGHHPQLCRHPFSQSRQQASHYKM